MIIRLGVNSDASKKNQDAKTLEMLNPMAGNDSPIPPKSGDQWGTPKSTVSDNGGGGESSVTLVTPPAIALPKGGGAIRGIGEKFAANPVNGTGSLSVPLATSPGRSGFGPQLSLNYDSGSGNGRFGYGWSLSIPSITCKTNKGLPQYSDSEESDVYILSGAEDLVPVLQPDGTRFKDATTAPGFIIHRYRPRVENLFARIERWTEIATQQIHWRTITRDNVTTLYGKDPKSRIADAARIFSWSICQSYDDKGNAIIYEYAEENADSIDLTKANERNRARTANRYPKRIKYGNRTPNRNAAAWQATDPSLLPNETWMFEVVLDYGEGHYTESAADAQNQIFAQAQINPAAQWLARQDPFSHYRACFEVRTYRLCRRVLMFHHFPAELRIADCLVRSTEFSYVENPANTFVASVSQSGFVRQGNQYLKKSLPPLEFEYSQAPIPDQLAQRPIRDVDPESLENLPIGLGGHNYTRVDLDGEGSSGILAEQAGAWYYKRNLSANNLVVEDGSQRTHARFGPIEAVASKPAVALAGSGQFMDFAGDGQIDVVQMEGAVRGFYERTDDADWAPFKPFPSWPNESALDPALKFVDLTGDGFADILITEGDVLTWYPIAG
jgi:Salmonella virulence plasmid 65kDa B protein